MSQINLTEVNSGYNLLKISSNFEEIERVINEELLHRVNANNTLPNTLEADIDANSKGIYNLRKPLTGGEPIRLKDLFGDPSELLQGPDAQNVTTIAGQTLITLTSNYVPGSNSLLVFRNGVYLDNTRYTETSTNTITLNEACDVGDVISVVPVAVTGEGGGTSDITATNVGTGVGVFKAKLGNTLQFKRFKEGSNIILTALEDDITINATAASVTASNASTTGEGVFESKVGDNLNFKRLKAGTNVTLSSDTNSITINASGAGGSATPVAVYDNGVLKTSTATSLNFVNTTIGSSGGAITVTAPSGVFLNVKDYGALGNGTTDDSAAIQSAITAAKASKRSVYFPDGTYLISTLGTQNGKVLLIGTGNSVLKGTFTYYDATFPISADTNTPTTPDSPYFSAQNMVFQSNSSDYGLKLSTIQQGGFLSTFNLSHCKFYGNKGLLAQHMIGFELSNCEFNNVVAGTRLEGCVNGLFVNCRWQNQAESGVWITNNVASPARAGGENMKFVLCEWAVCTYGLVADQHLWLAMESCLLDYCAVPLFLSGSKFSKASNTYFGASNHSVTRFSGVSGYLAPNASGVAVYGRPGGSPVGNRTVGFTAHNCEFINYVTGSANPVVVIDGYVNGTYPLSGEHISFYDCLFYMSTTHSAATLLYVKSSQVIRAIGNRFLSYNLSSSLVNAWIAESCNSYQGFANDFTQCTQSSISVGSTYEKQLANVVISASDPGSTIGAYGIWVQP